MTKAELVEQVQAQGGGELSRKALAELVGAIFEEIGSAVRQDGRFTYPGFGTFTVKERKARTGRNPRTGEEIKIAPGKTVGFKPAPELKKSL